MDDRVSITSTDIDTDDEIHDDDNEERTEAVLLAEQGRGLIVQAEGKSTVQLEVQPGLSISIKMPHLVTHDELRYDPLTCGLVFNTQQHPSILGHLFASDESLAART
jgi:hypothetical protein